MAQPIGATSPDGLVFPPLSVTRNRDLVLLLRRVLHGFNTKHRYLMSYQAPLLIESGRMGGVTDDIFSDQPDPSTFYSGYDIAIGRMRALRFARLGWIGGLRKNASLGLSRPLPNGPEDSDACDAFIEEGHLAWIIYNAIDQSTRDHAAKRYRIRVDIAYVMSPGLQETARDDTDLIYDPARTVDDAGEVGFGNTWSPDDAKILQWRHDQGKELVLRGYADSVSEMFKEFVESKGPGDGNVAGSDLVLRYISGAFVHATKTNVASLGAVTSSSAARGVLPDNPAVKDELCIARAIVTGLDPELHYRLETSMVYILRRARQGLTSDVDRYAAMPGKAAELALANVALRSVEEELSALQSTQKYTVFDEAAPSVRASSRYSAVESALVACMTGIPPEHYPDLSSPSFAKKQPSTVQMFEFVRGVVATVGVKLNFWTLQDGGVGLIDRDSGATLSFLRTGGRVLNLLLNEGHVSVMTSVTMLCHELAKTNKHIYCDLCGFELPRSTRGRKHQRTLLYEHQVGGCLASTKIQFTQPFSQDNIRQLPMQSFRSCYSLTVHCALSYWEGKHAAVVGRLRLPWGGVYSLPSAASSRDVEQSTAFLQRWTTTTVGAAAHVPSVISSLPACLKGSTNVIASADSFESDASLEPVNALSQIFHEMFSDRYVKLLYAAASFHAPRDATVAAPPLSGVCKFCKANLHGPSRDVLQRNMAAAISTTLNEVVTYDEDDDEDSPAVPSHLDSEGAVLDCDPATGDLYWAHGKCNAVARAILHPTARVFLDVPDEETLLTIADVVMRREFIRSVCRECVPSITKKGAHVRGIILKIPLSDVSKRGRDEESSRALVIRIRVVPLPVRLVENDGDANVLCRSLANTMLDTLSQYADRELHMTGLNPLTFDSPVAYARTALLHSVSSPQPPLTSIIDPNALEFVNRVTQGGRLVTGSRVVWPDLLSTDRSVARLYLDFTAKYPHVLLSYPLPHQEHTLHMLHDFTDELSRALRFIEDADVMDASQPITLLEISGEIPPHLHPSFIQFAPLFSRVGVSPSEYTPYQRMRLGLKLTDVPTDRTIAHLFPLDKAVVFMREAKILLRLGFKFSHVGQAWGCHASFWARTYAQDAEVARRLASNHEDKAAVAAIKLRMNSVIGSMKMNPSTQTSLKSVMTSVVDFDDGLTIGTERRIRLADDKRFTGRVFSAGGGDVTLVEMDAPPSKHKQMTTFALAVQAYARCDHLELMYGDGVRPGVFNLFPDAKVLYGNTDAVIFQIEKPGTDVRVEFYRKMSDRIDLSNVPLSSTFWSYMEDDERARALAAALNSKGKWGLLRDETGMAGVSAFVVNGPNRYGYRVVQSDTDTLPEHRLRGDVLKFLPKAWTETTTLEQYAHDWAGGPTIEERENMLADPSLSTDPIPLHGTCKWGNGAAIISREGLQWPLGARTPDVTKAMRDIGAV